MKNPFKAALVGTAAAVLLSGCGLVNSFIPDQSVTDAYGLDGETVTLTPVASSAALSPAAVAAVYSGSLSGSFDDVALPEGVPPSVRPSAIEEELRLGSSVTITTTPGTSLPSTLTIVGVDLAVSLDDASSDPAASQEADAAVSIELTGSCDASGTCSYTVASADDGTLLILALSGATFDELWTLLQNEVEPNELSGTMTLTFDEAFDASSIEIVLETEGGTLKFG